MSRIYVEFVDPILSWIPRGLVVFVMYTVDEEYGQVYKARIKMPALITEPHTVCASEPSPELVVEQKEATVKKATVPRDVRLGQYKSQCEDLIYFFTNEQFQTRTIKKRNKKYKEQSSNTPVYFYQCDRFVFLLANLSTHQLAALVKMLKQGKKPLWSNGVL